MASGNEHRVGAAGQHDLRVDHLRHAETKYARNCTIGWLHGAYTAGHTL
jgi:hypothetical protein